MTNTETVGTISDELLASLLNEAENEDWEDVALALRELQSLRASRTQSPAEWQKKLTDMFGVWLAIHGTPEQIDSYNGYYERAIAPFLLRSAPIPAPERSKEETVGVLSVPDAMAQLAAAIEAESHRNAVRDELLATLIVNVEKSEPTAEFAQNLRDFVREERQKLTAKETHNDHE